MYKIYRLPDNLPPVGVQRPFKLVGMAKSSKKADFLWVSLLLHHPTHVYRMVSYYKNEAGYDVHQENFLGDLSLTKVMKFSCYPENTAAHYVFRRFKEMLKTYEECGGKLHLNFDTWEVLQHQEDGSWKTYDSLNPQEA